MSDLIQEVKAALQAQEERLLGSTTTLLMNAPTWLKQLTDRVETAERQRDEAIKALEWYGDKEVWTVNVQDQWQPFTQIGADNGNLARTTLKRIKGDSQAEGHQSTESAQAQAGSRIGGSHE